MICICFLCLSRLQFYFVGSRGTWTEVKGWGCMEWHVQCSHTELGEGQCPENSASLRSVSVWPLLGAWNESRNPNGDASEVISKKTIYTSCMQAALWGNSLEAWKVMRSWHAQVSQLFGSYSSSHVVLLRCHWRQGSLSAKNCSVKASELLRRLRLVRVQQEQICKEF